MKNFTLCFSFILFIGTAFCQNQVQSYDSSFKALYKAVALHPGYVNNRGRMHEPEIRKWDKDIVIYVEGGSGKSRKEIISKLKNTIAFISPALGNKIKISFSDEKYSANYLIDLGYIGSRTGWYLKWDDLDNIYSCTMSVNTKTIFNLDQQAGLVSHYFLKSLGDFAFSRNDRSGIVRNDPSVASNMSHWREDINSIDLQILKLHYADDIKAGMAEKDIDHYFATHSN
jgi:hypothetical protein